MLINCPECELPVSDKAIFCPHCGYPINPDKSHRKPRNNSNKRLRLPNGFGQISEIKNRNLRNPFRAMVTIGKTPKGSPICRLLKPKSYFATYNDAYTALIDYNRNPYDLNESMTMNELFDRWVDGYCKSLNESSVRSINLAWRYCSEIHDMKVIDIRIRHIKSCMSNGTIIFNEETRNPTPQIKAKIKSVIGWMLDYAIEYELIDKNYARAFKLSKEDTEIKNTTDKEHIAFSEEELDILWNNISKINYIDVLLIQCYSGWRPQELGLIKTENVNLDEGLVIGGMKTKAGTGRVVPIHPKILPLIKTRYEEAKNLKSDFLINCTETYSKRYVKLTYSRYHERFKKIKEGLTLNPEHRPHDGRKTFATLAKKYKLDEYAIKYIMGHTITDLTERVYTDRDDAWLKEEIKKIK